MNVTSPAEQTPRRSPALPCLRGPSGPIPEKAGRSTFVGGTNTVFRKLLARTLHCQRGWARCVQVTNCPYAGCAEHADRGCALSSAGESSHPPPPRHHWACITSQVTLSAKAACHGPQLEFVSPHMDVSYTSSTAIERIAPALTPTALPIQKSAQLPPPPAQSRE